MRHRIDSDFLSGGLYGTPYDNDNAGWVCRIDITYTPAVFHVQPHGQPEGPISCQGRLAVAFPVELYELVKVFLRTGLVLVGASLSRIASHLMNSGPMILIHSTHEAGFKMGGIGAVLDGLLSSPSYLTQVDRTLLVGPMHT